MKKKLAMALIALMVAGTAGCQANTPAAEPQEQAETEDAEVSVESEEADSQAESEEA
ncbi:MAG: hypothetical protein IJV04_05960 [Lachnospiraceae bacterium]|nr:hypothetical protein [Lachnospiraceae bacterium]